MFAAAPLEANARLRTRLSALTHTFVVAADRGATTALMFGYEPNVVIGDLDSIDASTLRELQQRDVPIETYPRDKNATDGQLAVERALLVHPSQLLLLGFEVISLLPLNGDVEGIRTEGLRWRLTAEQLHLGDTRGVSNEPSATTASVSIEQGLLLVTRHFPLTTDH